MLDSHIRPISLPTKPASARELACSGCLVTEQRPHCGPPDQGCCPHCATALPQEPGFSLVIVLQAGSHCPQRVSLLGTDGHPASLHLVLITYLWLRSQAASFPEIRLNCFGHVAASHPCRGPGICCCFRTGTRRAQDPPGFKLN